MPQRLVVTGASGYIGARLVERARQRGHEVVVLGSRPAGSDVAAFACFPWRLGETPPPAALAGATALLHLAHDWASDRRHGTGPGNANPGGAEALARAAHDAGIARFVFASTTSARREARNAYGKIKFAIEERLKAAPHRDGGIVFARIGLVYGGPERAQYALMSRLAMLPVLPMIGLDREVQPIHVDEACDGLLALALDPPPGRQTVVLAGPVPVTFGAWLRTLRRARHGRALLLVPVPIGLALKGCDWSKRIPFLPTVERERVLGLAGAAAMPSAADLAALGLSLRAPARALTESRPARRRLIAESAAMLRYVAGAPVRSPGAIIRVARVVSRDPASRRALPWPAVRWPALLRFLEPIRPGPHHGLSRRLHLAAMVAETLPAQPAPRGPWWLGVTVQLALETIALPFRLVLGGLTR
jgi:nucleoside-diphosphate-sugar epimerase